MLTSHVLKFAVFVLKLFIAEKSLYLFSNAADMHHRKRLLLVII